MQNKLNAFHITREKTKSEMARQLPCSSKNNTIAPPLDRRNSVGLTQENVAAREF